MMLPARSALCALPAIFLLGLPALVVAQQAWADAEVGIVSDSGSDRTAATPQPANVAAVPPPDLSALSRAELEAWVRRLAEDNAALRDVSVTDDELGLRDTLAQQSERIAALEAQLAALLERVDRLASADPAGPAQPGDPFAPGASTDTPAVGDATPYTAPDVESPDAATSDGPAATPKVGEYIYTYEFGLIREATRGRVTLRDKDGNREKIRYDVSEYRDDAVWITLYFKNESDRPLRYTGLIALGGKKNFNDKRPPVLAQTPFRTPVLQPGEVFDLSQEIDVDRPWGVDVIELGKVQSYPEP